MYLHIGQDTVITTDSIVGIFDLDTTTISKATRDYLEKAEKSGNVVTVSYELPKSFIVCNENNKKVVYVTALSSQTIQKRIKSRRIEKNENY